MQKQGKLLRYKPANVRNTSQIIYPEMFLYQAESADQQTAAPNVPQAITNEEQLISEEEEGRLENRRVAVSNNRNLNIWFTVVYSKSFSQSLYFQDKKTCNSDFLLGHKLR